MKKIFVTLFACLACACAQGVASDAAPTVEQLRAQLRTGLAALDADVVKTALAGLEQQQAYVDPAMLNIIPDAVHRRIAARMPNKMRFGVSALVVGGMFAYQFGYHKTGIGCLAAAASSLLYLIVDAATRGRRDIVARLQAILGAFENSGLFKDANSVYVKNMAAELRQKFGLVA